MRGRESEIKNISGDARKVPVQDKDISMSYDHFTSRFRNKGGLTTFDCSLSNSGLKSRRAVLKKEVKLAKGAAFRPESMATNTSICGICSLRQITKVSDHWCPECEEAICNECKEHHKLLKATRRHETIPISDYKSIPSFITDIQQSCIQHDEHYQQYCIDHALPICFKCINDHRQCNVSTLENVTINVKTSGQFLDLESRLDDLLNNIDRMKKDRNANVINIEKMKTRQVKEIQQKIIKDLKDKESQSKERIQKVLSSVKEKETMINQCLVNFQSIKQHASNLQTFLGIKDIEVKVAENEQYLQSLITAKSFEHLDLVCKVDIGVHSILNNLKKFGSTEIKSQTTKIEFSRAKDIQAQLQVATTNRTVNDVKLILKKKITTEGKSVRGCCVSDDNFLITDGACITKLKFLTSDGTIKYDMSLEACMGYDITRVDEKHVAITSGNSWNYTPGFEIVNIADYTTSAVISCNLSRYSYVSTFADKIYYTELYDEQVVCCYLNGSPCWTFKDDSVLKLPRGITVDDNGNVFVVAEISSNMVVISNDGKYHKEILSKKDGLQQPSAIFFDKEKRELLVANLQQTAFLYNIT
ncbi:unnamed protein product [Mytilus edulis]|uniref:B box-type domain-containing protein n=1 Tax=Mytilus edulis TaxID=6550 RepID=A0A8S3T8Y6_MYTED|nr:unnamed protein product [Mytilus edulis]